MFLSVNSTYSDTHLAYLMSTLYGSWFCRNLGSDSDRQLIILSFQLSTGIAATLYEAQEVVLGVHSPFSNAGDFEVQLYESGNKDLLYTASPKSR